MLKITLYKSDLRHIGINKYANNIELEKNLTELAVLEYATYNALTYNTAEFLIEKSQVLDLTNVNYIKCEIENKKFYYTVNTFNYMQNTYYIRYICDLDYFHTFIEDFYLQESIDRDVLLQIQQATVRKDIYNKTDYLWQNPYLQHLPNELELHTTRFGGIFSTDPQIQQIGIIPTDQREIFNYYAKDDINPYVKFQFTEDDNNKLSNKFLLMYSQKDWFVYPTSDTVGPPAIILLSKDSGFELKNGLDPSHTGYDLPQVVNYTMATNYFSNIEQLKMYQLPIDFNYLKFDQGEDETVLINYFNTKESARRNACGVSLGRINVNREITNFWIYNFGYIEYKIKPTATGTGKTIDLFNQNLFFDSTKYHSSILLYYALNIFFTNTPLNLKCTHYLANKENNLNLNITCDGSGFALTIDYQDSNSYYNLNGFTNYYQQVDFTIPSISDSWTNYRNNSPATSITSALMPFESGLKNNAMAVGAGFMAGGPIGAAAGLGVSAISGIEGIINTYAHRYDLKHQENKLNSGATFSKLLDWTNLHYEIDGLTPPDLAKADFYFNYYGNIVSQQMSLNQWDIDKNPDNVNFLRIANIEQAFNFVENTEIRSYFQDLFSTGVRLWTKKIQII